MDFEAIDLRQDALAACYVKDETVQVLFARSAGSIASREGPNRYRAWDVLLTGACGDRWSVSRDRFDARYRPLPPLRPGADGTATAPPG
jgi:hypothetical protein